MGADRRELLLDDVRREAGEFSGTFAFAARNLTTGEELGWQEDRVMPTASTIKLTVLAELFRRVEQGDMRLDERVPLLEEDQRGGSGILKDLQAGLQPTLRDLATLMVALSDNVATAALVRLLGQEQIIATVHDWGLASIEALFRVPEGGDMYDYGRATPRDLVRLLALLDGGEVLAPGSRAAIAAILRTQQYNDQISRYLPYDPYARDRGEEQPVTVGSKSGFTRGIRVDAGLVWLPEQRYAIALMTAGSVDRTFAAEQEGMRLNGRVSRLVFDYWTHGSR
ncbi:MAG TPA: serine hydrolase [Thermomicrobiaceae bacterium]|nr:serine hydrolase [Thermomicrobiaceae bacterium]